VSSDPHLRPRAAARRDRTARAAVPVFRAAAPRAAAFRAAALRALLALLLALAVPALAGVGAAPARAAGSSGTATSRGAAIAAALRRSPVYVDPSYAAAAVTPAQQKSLAAQIAATGLPIKVVLVPLVKGDAFDGSSDTLASVVQDRLGPSPLIVITTDADGSWLDGYEWPSDTHQVRDAVSAVGFLKAYENAGLAARVSKAISLIKAGDGTAVYQQATADLDAGLPSASPTSAAGAAHGSSGGAVAGLVIAAVVVVLLAAGGAVLLRRRRATARRSAFSFPDAVFAAGRSAEEKALRERAASEVVALGEQLEDTDSAATPGLPRALDAYDAAGRVLDAARGIPDLAGVLALVEEARAALAGGGSGGKGGKGAESGAGLPLCFFNPLHGRAAQRLVWRPLGRRERVDVAACGECARALRARRSPEVLAVQDHGRTVPYFEVPAERSLWAATGYGSLLSGPGDSLASRVATGEFSRAHAQGGAEHGRRTAPED